MTAITEQVLEDGLWFLILSIVLAFFWFHREPAHGQTGPQKRN